MPKLNWREVQQIVRDIDTLGEAIRLCAKQGWPKGCPTLHCTKVVLSRLLTFGMRLQQIDTVLDLCEGPPEDLPPW